MLVISIILLSFMFFSYNDKILLSLSRGNQRHCLLMIASIAKKQNSKFPLFIAIFICMLLSHSYITAGLMAVLWTIGFMTRQRCRRIANIPGFDKLIEALQQTEIKA
jgi:hypothetical protein